VPERNRPLVEMRSTDEEFIARTQRYRPELVAVCYRMLGSLADAEDAVQETYLRAWRAYDSFESRSSERTWLYRIATNTCLTALAHHGRRVLPSGLGAPSDEPSEPPNSADRSIRWLQPVPDARVAADGDDPATIVGGRDSVRLALIVSLQYLPPRQRAVLILREVLAWSAAEVGALLDMSVAAVKSALQRARARLDEVAPSADHPTALTEREEHELLNQYIAAFEVADPAALERLLRHDAVADPSKRTAGRRRLLSRRGRQLRAVRHRRAHRRYRRHFCDHRIRRPRPHHRLRFPPGAPRS